MRGSTKHSANATPVCGLCVGKWQGVVYTLRRVTLKKTRQTFVPVFDIDGKTPLMPTRSARARKWIKIGKATPFWRRGVFCVRLNILPSSYKGQEVVVGIDPGSKREAFTVKSEAHTFINVQTSTPHWIKDVVDIRRIMRLARRRKRTPYRQPRWNRVGGLSKGNLPPSTLARWQWKLRVSVWLARMFPITQFIVEDIKAHTFGGKRWNTSFSPLQIGKEWLYSRLRKIASVELKMGWETKQMRDAAGLKKSGNKTAEVFDAHCVDSWILANSWTGGHIKPDNVAMLIIDPLRFHRRQLHTICPSKGGVRRSYGSTRSLGFKRGSIVKHPKWGICYIGGATDDKISLHAVETGERLCRNAKPEQIKFLTFNSWRWREVA